ncbi:zinc ribbon domain-containing protein [Williamsia sp.]|uniref:zinc ribbon domain-containing protein n=1 Tax=Williamsia sp. TaxID=1872085 RepID=UPI002F92526E
MKADPADQRLMLDIADVDAELHRIEHRRSTLPELAELVQLEEQLSTQRDEAVRAQIAAEDLQREARRLDNEITSMSMREEKDNQQLAAGTLPSKQLSELEHEVTGLIRRRGLLEDELLDVMEQQEAVDADEQRASAMTNHTQRQIDEVATRRDAALEKLAQDEAAVREKRAAIMANVNADLMAIYDRQVKAGRVGAGLLRAARCGACRMELDRGLLSRINATPTDDVIRCDECGAILVRTHESGLASS